jgi:hypothetical protein
MSQEGVDHHVAHRVDPLRRHAFPAKVFLGGGFRGEQPVGKRIGDDAVGFLRHGSVEAPQAGFHVGHADAELGGRQGGGERRVDVADDHHGVGAVGAELLLQALHDFGDLPHVCARADSQVDVRLGDVELAEERLAHSLIVVLPGVYQSRAQVELAHGANQRRDLHEIRSRARDERNLHRQCSSRPLAGKVSVQRSANG